MAIHHAVLALLADGPSYGYELKSSFEESIGPQWGELNIGHLYQILDRLVRDELVTRKVIAQEDRPDKIVYRLTVKGREELDSWLAQPFVRQSGYRDDFFLKLFASSKLGKRALRQTIRVQRDAYLSELASLAELRTEYEDVPLVALLVDAAVLHTEANLKLVERAEENLDQLVKAERRSASREGLQHARRAASR
jgi:DNA-binding PadR family transcriptional regulator